MMEMAASAAITLAVKAAAVAATDKRARPAIASVVIAMFLSFILMTFMILCALTLAEQCSSCPLHLLDALRQRSVSLLFRNCGSKILIHIFIQRKYI